MYVIYDKACMYNQDGDKSAGRQIDRSGVKYRSTSHPEYTYMAYHLLET